MTTSVPDGDLEVLGRANPDAVGLLASGSESGRSTIFYGARNQTLYIDDRPRGSHNIVLYEHPEIVEEILPPDIFERYRSGEFFDPRRGGQTWEVVASYALLGRLGGIHAPGRHYNVVSVWPRSLAGIPGKLEPVPGLLDEALPGLLRALKGDGIIHSFGETARIDDSWIMVVQGELGPVTVGEYLSRHGG
jgi:hypothetical protein